MVAGHSGGAARGTGLPVSEGDPLGIEFYPGGLFSALLPWVWFTSCLGSAGGLFVNNRALLWQTSYRPFVLVLVNILANLVVS
jgi:ABC-2 type transport system permease protein/lipopolysaccharide transport system permease protein